MLWAGEHDCPEGGLFCVGWCLQSLWYIARGEYLVFPVWQDNQRVNGNVSLIPASLIPLTAHFASLSDVLVQLTPFPRALSGSINLTSMPARLFLRMSWTPISLCTTSQETAPDR